jgi:glutaredoxin-like protein NrdH
MQHISGKSAGNIKLFALSTCPWCRKTKQLLDDLGVEYYFTDVDLLNGEERSETMKTVRKWNPNGSFPTLVIDDNKCIVGFKEEEIREALEK